jgi:hypothetical protein
VNNPFMTGHLRNRLSDERCKNVFLMRTLRPHRLVILKKSDSGKIRGRSEFSRVSKWQRSSDSRGQRPPVQVR